MTKTNGSRKGFTLAEVLITLGIIGVVAAMTIPTLIQNTNSVKFATQFKKDISTLSQAALMAQAQYDTDYATTTDLCGDIADTSEGATSGAKIGVGTETLSAGGYSTICAILNTTLAGKTYLGKGTAKSASDSSKNYTWTDMKTLKGDYALSNMHLYSLADGSLVGVHKDAKGCALEVGADLSGLASDNKLKNCIGFIDVNGTALPNKETVCQDVTGNNNTTSNPTELNPTSPCTVTSKASEIGDIFPIVFHDGTVEPASNAAKAVLTRGK